MCREISWQFIGQSLCSVHPDILKLDHLPADFDPFYKVSGDGDIIRRSLLPSLRIIESQGKRTSRPPTLEATKKQIARFARKGKAINQIRKELSIGYGTASKYVKGT